MSKKLLYISNRVFWPPMGGHEVEMYHYCRGLCNRGFTVDAFVFDDETNVDISKKPDFINDVHLSAPISKATKIRNIMSKSLFRKKAWPIQCSLYYSKENFDKIKAIASQGYDAVIVDMIRLAPYYSAFDNLDGKKILDIDDTLSKRYKRQLVALDEKTVIAGQYNDRLPSFLQKILSSKFVKSAVLKFEIPRMERAEELYSQLYDNVVFVSSIETEEFNKSHAGNKAVTVAMGVDYTYFSEPKEIEKEFGTASFVGNMKTAANVDSVRMIIDKVLPHSKKLQKIYFIGGCPESLIAEYKNNPRVEFTGRVEDLREYVKKTHLFLSPLSYGTGIKTKILEAMAMGVPVITNSIGAEGIGAINHEHWLASDDVEQIGEYIDFLLDQPEEENRIGRNAQALVKDKFQWEYIFEQFSRLGL